MIPALSLLNKRAFASTFLVVRNLHTAPDLAASNKLSAEDHWWTGRTTTLSASVVGDMIN